MSNNKTEELSVLQKQLIVIASILIVFVIISGTAWRIVRPDMGYFAFLHSLITGRLDDVEAEEKTDEPKYDADGDLLGIQDRPYIYDVIPLENVSAIEIQNVDSETGKKRNFSFYMDRVANNLILSGREMLSFNKETLSYLYVNTCNMLSMAKVDNPSEDLSQYGLENGVSDTWFKVTTADGQTKQVYIGDKLPTGAAYYCKSVDKPHIYVIDTMIERCVLASPDDYIVPMLCPPIAQEKMYAVDDIKLVTNGELKVNLMLAPKNAVNSEDGVAFSHIMTYPGGYTVSQAKVDNIITKLANFQGTKVEESDLFGIYSSDEESDDDAAVTTKEAETSDNTEEEKNADNVENAEATEENTEISEEDKKLLATLEKYGMVNPSHEIHYTLDDKDYKIIFGGKTPDGSAYYAMNMTQMTICSVPCADVAFLDYELIDFVDEYIFQMNIDNLSTIEVQTKKVHEVFALEGKGGDLVVKKTSDGAAVDTKTFRQFYIDVLLVTMTGSADTYDTSNEVLAYIFTTRDGRKYEYRFYDISTTKVYYTVNGVGEFYVNRDSVNKVINNFNMLLAGETFVSEAIGG